MSEDFAPKAFSSFADGMRIFGPRERVLFQTHQPPFRSPSWAAGQVLQHEGRFYRVTRWVELRPVALERGGSVREWQLWGRRVSDRQMRREVVSAAEAILGDQAAPDR
jgi:hypothetical protein